MAATTPRRPPQRPAVDPGVFDAFAADAAARAAASDVPVEPASPQRSRLRRGGPRTPLPLLPLIGLAAGVALAYVGQTAHVTSTTYRASSLEVDHTQLQQEAQRLSDELDRLRAPSRIDAAALQLGLQPPAKWGYVSGAQLAVTVPGEPGRGTAPAAPADPLQRLVADLSGTLHPTDAEAASR